MGFFSKQRLNKGHEVERLMKDYGDAVLKTAYMYLKDMHRAEDVFQEVFIKIVKNYESFRGDSSEKTWIIRITINTCRDFLKSFWNTKVIQEEELLNSLEGSNTENEAIDNIENSKLFQQVLNLPSAYKEVIILYYYHSFSTAEIGKMLSIPEGTVRSRMSRGRELLKKSIIKEKTINGELESI